MVPMALFLREPNAVRSGPQQSMPEAIREAFAYKPFLLLLAGYFVCGFQLVFIGVHMPAYLKDRGLTDPGVAVMALALIGLFNIVGSYMAGRLGGWLPKRYLLSSIYLTRAAAIALFLVAPLTPASVYVFSAVMGLLWLSTVPLTNGVIAGIFGVRYLSMLSGFVFLFAPGRQLPRRLAGRLPLHPAGELQHGLDDHYRTGHLRSARQSAHR